MTSVKRIEAILPEAVLQHFTDILAREGVLAYATATGLAGRNRLVLAGPGLCDATVTILCRQEEAPRLMADIDAFLARYGGIGSAQDVEALGIA